jgi:hypothetical protein
MGLVSGGFEVDLVNDGLVFHKVVYRGKTLAGVIQYLNVKNGQSRTLLKLPDEASVLGLELTDDRGALCCYCCTRPKLENIRKKRENFVQVWNYPALCKAIC